MREIQPDDFVALDGSVQTVTAAEYAEAADAMLTATETPLEEGQVATDNGARGL